MKLAMIMVLGICLCMPACSTPSAQESSANNPSQSTAHELAPTQAKLPFLANVPEFYELDLTITEDKLQALITKNGLLARVCGDTGWKTYHVFRKDGENVIVMFKEGKCAGIQRMQPDLLEVPKNK